MGGGGGGMGGGSGMGGGGMGSSRASGMPPSSWGSPKRSTMPVPDDLSPDAVGSAERGGTMSPANTNYAQRSTAGSGGDLHGLLQAMEVADVERQSRLHSAQVLTCCRMHGVNEPSAMLRAVISDVTTDEGRVDYVRFVQQLAAQRASASARASLVAGLQLK